MDGGTASFWSFGLGSLPNRCDVIVVSIYLGPFCVFALLVLETGEDAFSHEYMSNSVLGGLALQHT